MAGLGFTKVIKRIIFAAGLFVLVFFVYQFLSWKIVSAGTEHNLTGWAWSEYVGFISFNSTNQGGVINYGVNVDSTGLMSGNAWSENIGWISFNTVNLTGCPSAPCEARLTRSNGQVSGWGKALAGGAPGEWDGWIKLRGVAQDLGNYGVLVTNCSWDGWAWGGDSGVGWIHFKGTNYGVNGSGTACKIDAPTAYAGPAHTNLVYNTPHPHSGATASDINNNLTSYVWEWVTPCPGGSCPTLSGNVSGTISGGSTSVAVPGPTFAPLVSGNYTLKLTVTDLDGAQGISQVTDTLNNIAPIAEAGIAIGSTAPTSYSSNLVVQKGIPVNFWFSANYDVTADTFASRDLDGWADPGGKGVYNSVLPQGKCEWNLDLNQITPTFEFPVNNPLSAAVCNIGPYSKTFTDAAGTIVYDVLRITDAPGALSNVSQVSVTVQNSPPVSNAGTDASTPLGSIFTLPNGSASDVNNNLSSYKWEFTSCPGGLLSCPALNITCPAGATCTVTQVTGPLSGGQTAVSVPGPTFTPVNSGSYTLRLTATDNDNSLATDDVIVATTNSAPVIVSFGSSHSIAVNSAHTHDGASASDTNNNLSSYKWEFSSCPGGLLSCPVLNLPGACPIGATTCTATQVIGPLSGGSTSVAVPGPTFTPVNSGNYNLRLTITDSAGSSSNGEVADVTINLPPVAEAGVSINGTTYYSNVTVTKGVATNMWFSADKDVNADGKASLDPDGWTDSNNGVYGGGRCEWNINLHDFTLGFPVNATSSNPLSASICNVGPYSKTFTDSPGVKTYYLLRVTDRLGLVSNLSSLTVTIQNNPPTANAGLDTSAPLGQSFILPAGSASDINKNLASYSWAFVASCPGGTCPTPSAGASGLLPNNTSPASVPGPTFTLNSSGTYTLRLTVIDNDGVSATDDVLISTTNSAPVIPANPPHSIPAGSIHTHSGATASDVNNDLSTYTWVFNSCPGTCPAFDTTLTYCPIGVTCTATQVSGTISGGSTAVAVFGPTFTPLNAGGYSLRLTVSDSSGTQVINSVIDSTTNIAPVSESGISKDGITYTSSITVTKGVSTPVYLSADKDVTGDGLYSRDPDGWTDPDKGVSTLPGKCEWNQDLEQGATPTFEVSVSAPASPVSCNRTLTPQTFNDAISGGVSRTITYNVLKITDKPGLTSNTAQVSVVVQNNPPTANAGIGDIMVLGTEHIHNGAKASDPNNNLSTYLWELISCPGVCPAITVTGGNPGTITGGQTQVSVPSPTYTPNVSGNYVLKLTITDTDLAQTISQITESTSNNPPVAEAGVSLTGLAGSYAQSVTVTKGVATTLYLSADKDVNADTLISRDPDGWSDPAGKGVYSSTHPTPSGGKCEWNSDLNQGIPIFEPASDVVNPVNAGACNIIINPLPFNNAAGTYNYQVLRITDRPSSQSNVGQISVTVQNNPPTVNAGLDTSTALGQSFILPAGSASDINNNLSSYSWAFVAPCPGGTCPTPSAGASGPLSLGSAPVSVPGPTFTLSNSGAYTLRLTVFDNDNYSATDDVVISTTNSAPTISGCVDHSVPVNSAHSHSGCTAGDVNNNLSSYTWVFVSCPGTCPSMTGDTGSLPSGVSSASVPGPSYIPVNPGTYTLQLTVTDSAGSQAIISNTKDTTNNLAPISEAGISKNGITYTSGVTVTKGVATTIYLSADKDVTGDTLSSRDPDGWTDAAKGVSTLPGKCEWNRNLDQGNPPTFELPSIDAPLLPGSCNITLTPPPFNDAAGTYTYQVLRITDAGGLQSAVASVNITVQNNPPTANAGIGDSIPLGTSHAHTGASVTDPNGNLQSYIWEFTSCPNGLAACPALSGSFGTISGGSYVITGPTYTPTAIGNYILRLTVTDSDGVTHSNSITETTTNSAPTIPANPAHTINIGSDHTHSGATASDTNNNLSSYSWTFISCPLGVSACPTLTGSSGSLSGGSTAVLVPGPIYNPSNTGNYTLRLTITDTGGLQATSDVTDISSNLAPVAEAGISTNGISYTPSITVTKGVSTPIYLSADKDVTGDGLYSRDPDGWTDPNKGVSTFPGKCEWNRDLNQGIPTFELPNIDAPLSPGACNITISPTFNDSIPGGVSRTITYNVLKITDKPVAISTVSQVTVTIQNNPPTANAGLDTSASLGQSFILPVGSASDINNNLSSYSWAFVAPCPGGTCPTPSSGASGPLSLGSAPVSVPGPTFTLLNSGTYTLRLTVTDSDGVSATDDVLISTTNSAPTIPANPSHSIPVASIHTHSGATAGDVNNDLSSYAWIFNSCPGTCPAFDTTLTYCPAGVTCTATQVSGTISGGSTAVAVFGPTFTPLNAGGYSLRLTVSDSSGTQVINSVIDSTTNIAPVSESGISKDGITYTSSITVTKGVSTPIYLSADKDVTGDGLYSRDPDGWTDPDKGVSTLPGKCEWNQDLEQGATPIFEVAVSTPASPGACNRTLIPQTFNDAVSGGVSRTITYNVLKITDKPGLVSNVGQVSVVIQNNPPTANAGTGELITLGSPHTHNGAVASDPNNNLSTYLWELISCPGVCPAITVTGGNPGTITGGQTQVSVPSPTYTPNVSGNYVLKLTITDTDLAQTISQITESTSNNPPVAEAGVSTSATGPFGSSITVQKGIPVNVWFWADKDVSIPSDGLFSRDPDGWTSVNGVSSGLGKCEWNIDLAKPFAAQITDPLPASATVCNKGGASGYSKNFLLDPAGTQTYDVLRITDATGAQSAISQISVIIQNSAPVATPAVGHISAPLNQQHTHNGFSATDANSNLSSYSWEFTSCPGVLGACPTLSGASGIISGNSANILSGPTYTPTVAGSYILKLTITDNDGASQSANITETVVNSAPVISTPGSAHIIPLDVQHPHSGATVTDADNNLASYIWTFISCPPSGTAQCPSLIGNTSSLTGGAAVINGPFYTPTKSGSYFLRLTVTDAEGSQTTADVTETTLNNAPVAEVGVSKNGINFSSVVSVTKGVPVNLWFSADKDVTGDLKASDDKDGWTDSLNGVSSGGKCEWNGDLVQGGFVAQFGYTVDNPASQASCNSTVQSLSRTFNDTPGTYTYNLLRLTDRQGATSNISSISIQVQVPDLIISANPTLNTGTLVEGQNLTFKGTIKNQGATQAVGTFNNRFEVDLNNNGTVDLTVSPNPTLSNLNSTQETEVISGLWSNVPAGIHRIILCADQPTPSITEADENNNCNLAGTGVFNILPKPELIPENLSSSPINAAPGTAMTFSANIRNKGGSQATSTTITRLRIDLDSNGTWDVVPPTIPTLSTNPVLAGSAETKTWNNIWPAEVGTTGKHKYEICADLTDLISENNETDNCQINTFTIQSNTVILTANPTSGISPLFTALTANVIGTGVGTLNYSFWWNCNNPTTDVNAAITACGALPAGSSGICLTNANGAKCDNMPLSTVEINRTYTDSPTSYKPKVIVQQGVAPSAESRATITVSPQPELTVSQISIPANPVSGTQITISGTIKNQGGSPASSTITRLRIDENNNGTWDFGPPGIPNQNTGQLNINSTETETWTNAYTTQLGTHKVEVCADLADVVDELNEEDNCVTQTFVVQVASVSLSVTPFSGSLPLNTNLTATVSGTAVGTVNYYFWWNCNDPSTNLSQLDSVNGCGVLPTPPAGSCSTPSSFGVKCLGITPTSQIVSNTYNSIGVSTAKVVIQQGAALPAEARKTVTVSAPDLIVSSNPVKDTGSLIVGYTVTFKGMIKNQGDAAVTSTFSSRFQIDVDNNGSIDVTLPSDPQIASLAVGASQQVISGSWTNIPVGIHRVILCADVPPEPNGVIPESLENNNCNPSGTGTITVGDQVISVNLAVNPVSGTVPLTSTLTATVSGTALGRVNYSFWWNCDNPVTWPEAASDPSACGALETPSAGVCVFNERGAKCNDVDSSSQSINHTYTSAGEFRPKIIIERGSAPSVENRALISIIPPPLSASCSVSPISVTKGQIVTWSASATGGTGTYSYSWSGDDPLNGQTGYSVSVSYGTNGTKNGSVTVISGTESVSAFCSNSVVVSSAPVCIGLCAGEAPPPSPGGGEPVPVRLGFTAAPSTIVIGESASLFWTTQGADSCSIDQGIGQAPTQCPPGNTDPACPAIRPTATTNYTLTCSGAGGFASASAKINAFKAPTFIEKPPGQ